uniref:Esterase OVCA2 n=1 Tax=Neogobius melanostomus TaxID=47308 RepID=A0A8C6SVI0_9GOBI
MAPLRVLSIHGYRQNGGSFREKTGALRKLLKKSVELVQLRRSVGLIMHPDPKPVLGPVVDADARGWWFSDIVARSFSAQQQCEVSLGLDQSVTAVRDIIRTQGPFDGILGFSQGRRLSACSEHERFYKSMLQIPSLHVFGQDDRVIPDHMSKDLLTLFKDPQILMHPGGHFVPAASAHRQTYQDFLKRFQ